MKTSFITTIFACLLVGMLASCSAITSGITGQPIPSTSVQRAGHDNAPVIQIASADLALAEQGDPATIHGLYDAGMVAARIGGASAIVINGRK